MSAEAGVSIDFYPNKFYSYVKIFDFFESIGWRKGFENEYYFTIIDESESYLWDKYTPSSEEIREILEKNQKNGNGVGITLYYKNTEVGIDALLFENGNVIFSYLINRKTLENEFCCGRKKTDMKWYQQTIVNPFKEHFSDSIKELRFIESYW